MTPYSAYTWFFSVCGTLRTEAAYPGTQTWVGVTLGKIAPGVQVKSCRAFWDTHFNLDWVSSLPSTVKLQALSTISSGAIIISSCILILILIGSPSYLMPSSFLPCQSHKQTVR